MRVVNVRKGIAGDKPEPMCDEKRRKKTEMQLETKGGTGKQQEVVERVRKEVKRVDAAVALIETVAKSNLDVRKNE